MSDQFDPYRDIFGGKKPSADKSAAAKPDPQIAFDVWRDKQPFFQKIPKGADDVIKIKAGDFRKIAFAAYKAGMERAAL